MQWYRYIIEQDFYDYENRKIDLNSEFTTRLRELAQLMYNIAEYNKICLEPTFCCVFGPSFVELCWDLEDINIEVTIELQDNGELEFCCLIDPDPKRNDPDIWIEEHFCNNFGECIALKRLLETLKK